MPAQTCVLKGLYAVAANLNQERCRAVKICSLQFPPCQQQNPAELQLTKLCRAGLEKQQWHESMLEILFDINVAW